MGQLNRDNAMKHTSKTTDRQLTGTIIVGVALAAALLVMGLYHYFDGILREYFFR